MKIIRILTVLSIVLIAFSSCRKDNTYETSVSGYITEYGTDKPIPNATVILSGCYASGSLSGGDCDVVQTVQTDEDGYYQIQRTDPQNFLFSLSAEAPDYFDWESSVAFDAGRTRTFNATLDPHAWLEWEIRNVSPFNSSDRIHSTFGVSNQWDDIYGSQVDTLILRKVRGNRDRNLLWSVIKNNEQIDFRDTIFIPAHQIIRYTIEY